MAKYYVTPRKDASAFRNNNDFMEYSVELHKEFLCLYTVIIDHESYRRGKLSRKDAIIFGLLCKTKDILTNQLVLICEGTVDSIHILNRTALEIFATIMVMIKRYDDDCVFDDYIKYSLLTEIKHKKHMLEEDQNQARQTEEDIKVRERIKRSIDRALLNSGIDIENFDVSYEKENNFWKKNGIRKRFEIAGYSYFYGQYELGCHSTHGNWQNLELYFLDFKDGVASVDKKVHRAKPQIVLPYIVISGMLLSAIVDLYVNDTVLKDQFTEQIDFCCSEVRQVDYMHEKYLENCRNNHSY